MRILVGVKRVIDYAVKVRVNAAKSGVETKNVKMSMNPFCEIATEEAIKLKEKGIATEVIAVTVGPKEALAQLQTALAMGADRGIHIETDLSTDSQLQPLLVSKALAAMAKKHDAQMIILGKQAIDDDANQTGQMCAGLLNWPQATYASSLAFAPDKKSLTVAREVDGGSQKLSMSLPAVITADLRLNQPRYATLPNIMKAKKKPVENLKLSDLGFDLTPRLRTVSVADPPTRKAGIKVDSVEALVNELKNTAKVI